MNTAALKTKLVTSSYGEQYSKLLDELTFVEDDYLNLHCVELDFANLKEQSDFFNIHETDLPNDCQISCCFTNLLFNDADFLVLTNTTTAVNYQLYLTFKRQQWQSDIALENFSAILMTKLNRKNLACKLEMTEEFGVYLSVNHTNIANSKIGHRVEQLSQTLLTAQQSILRQ